MQLRRNSRETLAVMPACALPFLKRTLVRLAADGAPSAPAERSGRGQAPAALYGPHGLAAICWRLNTTVLHPQHGVFPYLLQTVTINRSDWVWGADIARYNGSLPQTVLAGRSPAGVKKPYPAPNWRHDRDQNQA